MTILRTSLLLQVTIAISLALCAARAWGQSPCADPSDMDCLTAQAEGLLEQGRSGEALQLLRSRKAEVMGDRIGVLLLARAYAAEGNAVWARRSLTTYLDAAPDDCLVRAHLAWQNLEAADYRAARAVLAGSACPLTTEDRTRWRALEAMAAHEAGDSGEAGRLLGQARAQPAAYPEDRPFLEWLNGQVRPLQSPPLEARAEVGFGWSSNPLLGSPLDPQASDAEYASAKSEGDLWLKGATPAWGPIRLFLEGTGKYQWLMQEPAVDLSYGGFGLRPGLELAWPAVATRAAYHVDAVVLASGDAHHNGAHWFSEGHRLELELESGLGLTAFAGGGRRFFGTLGRTRWEVDGGLGGGLHLGKGVGIIGAATVRRQWANDDAYNLLGASVIAALSVPLPARFSLRGSVAVGVDAYPDSAGALAFHSPEARKDVQVRGKLALWSPNLPGQLRLGLVYEPVKRFSTADLYEFSDQSVALVLGWRGHRDPWLPAASDPGSYAIEYGLSGDGGLEQDRVQDLLRQDEEAQRGSSCLN